MTKDEAQREVIRKWRALPVKERSTHAQAQAFAREILPDIDFETLGDRGRIIEGWIVRDMEQYEAVLRQIP